MSTGEIEVSEDLVNEAINGLQELLPKIEDVKVNSNQISGEKGVVAVQFELTENNVEILKEKMTILINNTIKLLTSTLSSFQETDSNCAQNIEK